MSKVYAISDLHLCISGAKPMEIFGNKWDNYLEKIKTDWQSKVNDDDIVLIAGDISWAMKLEEAQKDLAFFSELKGKKIIIRGNHDYWWQSISKVRNALPENVFAIQNDSIKIDNFIFTGTRGWTVPEKQFASDEDKKIYEREIIRLEMALQSAVNQRTNNEPIIAMIHYPPYNSKMVDSDFTKLFEKYGVSKVIYGHLHSQYNCKLGATINGVEYYLTSCDQVNNKLIEIY